jgi:hypothetical protein
MSRLPGNKAKHYQFQTTTCKTETKNKSKRGAIKEQSTIKATSFGLVVALVAGVPIW